MSVAVQTTQIRQRVQAFDFQNLFLEELGWDSFTGQPLPVLVNGHTYLQRPVAQKSGFAVFRCDPDSSGALPDYDTRRKIEEQVARQAREHLIIFVDAAQNRQVWQWVRSMPGKPKAYREQSYYRGQSAESLAQRLQRMIFDFSEAAGISIVTAARRVTSAFDVDRVTKRFYDRFKTEQNAFLAVIKGIANEDTCKWYASLMLNRLMFTYFIQKKGFLAGDVDYLPNRLRLVQQHYGQDQFHSFYRSFLLRLFHDGLGQREHSPELVALIGDVPYLNGGFFEPHQIEQDYPNIEIPDGAFARIFAFFDEYHWHLDERPLRADNEINPDVLGYIFEKYINQKQMGAYYTKEDITGYISKNTIIPFLFEAAQPRCPIAFEPGGEVWRLLRDDPDRYLYEPVLKGVDLNLPPEIAVGVNDVTHREGWNRSADANFALPTETWREHITRRARSLEMRAKLADGAIASINDLITYNLDIERFAQDVLERSEGPELLRAFWRSIEQVSVLDPTCGSGAFLFAALNLLEPLYEACLDRMQAFVDEAERTGQARHFPDFREVLARVAQHPNRRYFILKSIIINNLYGVDIMEAAVEIARLRLFLKLVAQVEDANRIEPLPDIDFNIRAGNTLVGYATYTEVQRAVTSKFDWDDAMARIEQKAGDLDQLFEQFRAQQTTHGGVVKREAKEELRHRLGELADELDHYLAAEYGLDERTIQNAKDRAQKLLAWRASHQPFHWFIEFYGIVHKRGGFDVIIGNPPFVEYSKVKGSYQVKDYLTEACGNLYTFVLERSLQLVSQGRRCGLIVPVSLLCTERMIPAQRLVLEQSRNWCSSFDMRPSSLFSGISQRLTILLMEITVNKDSILAGGYHRWHEEGRPSLLNTGCYVGLEKSAIKLGYIPKIATSLELSITAKLRGLEISSLETRGQNKPPIYVHRIVRYFVKALDFVPFFSNEAEGQKKSEDYKPFYFQPEMAETISAILNSSLFYWFWHTFSDGFHCGYRDVRSFSLAHLPEDEIVSSLSNLNRRLMADLKSHAVRRIASSKATGRMEYDEFYPRLSKPIIDEVDLVLARHYGFTDEELDFIVNYDIKYRMGQNEDEGNEA